MDSRSLAYAFEGVPEWLGEDPRLDENPTMGTLLLFLVYRYIIWNAAQSRDLYFQELLAALLVNLGSKIHNPGWRQAESIVQLAIPLSRRLKEQNVHRIEISFKSDLVLMRSLLTLYSLSCLPKQLLISGVMFGALSRNNMDSKIKFIEETLMESLKKYFQEDENYEIPGTVNELTSHYATTPFFRTPSSPEKDANSKGSSNTRVLIHECIFLCRFLVKVLQFFDENSDDDSEELVELKIEKLVQNMNPQNSEGDCNLLGSNWITAGQEIVKLRTMETDSIHLSNFAELIQSSGPEFRFREAEAPELYFDPLVWKTVTSLHPNFHICERLESSRLQNATDSS